MLIDLSAASDWTDIQSVIEINMQIVDHLEPFLPVFTVLPIQPIESIGFIGKGYGQVVLLDYIGKLGTVRDKFARGELRKEERKVSP